MPENQDTLDTPLNKDEKPSTKDLAVKLLLLVAIVFSLTKWGVPFMNQMVDEFKKSQDREKEVIQKVEKLTYDEEELAEDTVPSDEDKLRFAIENEINLWVKKRANESSAIVRFINANDDGSKLAVEYLEKNADGETESKELLFKKDEFDIYIYQDQAGVRQIRVRQPK